MNDYNKEWLSNPDKYFPPLTIISIMQWHISLEKLMNETEQKQDHIIDVSEIGQRDQELMQRDKDFFMRLSYPVVARIETAMLIGRELWYGERSFYKTELKTVPLTDLDKWAELFDIPLTEQSESKKSETVDYMTCKRPEIWEAYISAVKR